MFLTMLALRDKSSAKGNLILLENVVQKVNALPVVSAVFQNCKPYVEKDVAFMVNVRRMACAALKKRERRVGTNVVQVINLFVWKGSALLCVIKKDLVVSLLFAQRVNVVLQGVIQNSVGESVVPRIPFV